MLPLFTAQPSDTVFSNVFQHSYQGMVGATCQNSAGEKRQLHVLIG